MNWSKKISNFIEIIKSPDNLILMAQGLGNTVKVATIGLLLGILIGTFIGVVKVAPKYKVIMRILDKICSFYVMIFRGTPMVVQLLIAYFVILPLCGVKGVSALKVGMVVFGMNSGAYQSEIMRSGLNSVDRGQLEAGRALGLGYGIAMLKIVVPQAFKNILPTIGNEFISLIKETSVLSFITIYDLYTVFHTMASSDYEYMVPYIVMAIIYIILVIIISIIIKLIEKVFARSDREAAKK